MPRRREFLGQLASGAAAIVVAGGVTKGAAQAATKTDWDLKWIERITGEHRAVFDSPQLEDGTALNNAYLWLQGYHDVYNTPDSAMSAVVVMRHAGVTMAFDDQIWDKYELGKELKVNDPTTGDPARRNPFKVVAESDKHSEIFSGASITALQQRGVIMLACALAASGRAARIAKAHNLDAKTVQDEVRAHIIPGITLVPSGIFGVMRAQEAGCHYLRSS